MKYGIKNGQIYQSSSGGHVQVIDCETFASCDDAVIRDEAGEERRIDAFKLAMVRYSLVAEDNPAL